MNTIVERFIKIQSKITSIQSDKPVNVIAVEISIRTCATFNYYGIYTLEKIKFKKLWSNGRRKKS